MAPMHSAPFLTQAVLIFGAALLIAWLFRILRAPAVIGYLFAGILLGPTGFRIIGAGAIEGFAEIGLVLLLFTIGLELSPGPLLRTGRGLLLAAGAQIGLSVAITFGLIGWLRPMPVPAALVLGSGIALSSTAIVLKQLSDRGTTDTSGGLLITGILLLQDVFVILLMLFLPVFGSAAGGDWQAAAWRGAVSVAGLVVTSLAARWVVPQFLRVVVKWGGRELTTLFAVVAAIGGAWLAGMAGWSWALGSCIAGLILSQTDLRHQLIAEIVPFRDVFNALFFISIGMLVDLPQVGGNLPLVGAAVAVTLVGKAMVTIAAVRLARWPLRLAVLCGIGLCTVSEFAYVLAREATRLSVVPASWLDEMIAYIVGTMLLGSMMFPIANRVSLAVVRLVRGREADGADESGSGERLADHVIVVGFGLNGQNLARVLKATSIPFCVIELNQALAQEARVAGHRVLVGDAVRMGILRHAGVEQARAVVVAISDLEATRRIVAQARATRPDVYVLARTRYTKEIETLRRLGANLVIPEEFETSIEIFAHVLHHFGIPDNVVEAQVMMIRAGNYGMLRGQPSTAAARIDLQGLLEATATQTYMLESGSPACGRSIRELNLRATTGVTIIAVVRGGKPATNPPADWVFAAGDVLVLVGGHREIDEAKGRIAAAIGG